MKTENEINKLSMAILKTGIIQKELVRNGLIQSEYQNRKHLTPDNIRGIFRGININFIEEMGLSYERDENNKEIYHPLTLAINASFHAIVMAQNCKLRIDRLKKEKKCDTEILKLHKLSNFQNKLYLEIKASTIMKVKRIQKRLRKLENDKKHTTIRQLVIEIFNLIIIKLKK